jgi:hypothetical protein
MFYIEQFFEEKMRIDSISTETTSIPNSPICTTSVIGVLTFG